MSYLLRRTRRGAWVGDKRSRDEAVREFERTDADTDGLSVFEVENDEQRAAVVAAIACERQNTNRVDLLEVERDVIERYGVVQNTPDKGTTPVPAANALHCSLDWDVETLRRFAEDLFAEGRAPREHSAAAVRAAVRRLDPNGVLGDEAQAFVRAERAKAAVARETLGLLVRSEIGAGPSRLSSAR
jgi:hypothetical protein